MIKKEKKKEFKFTFKVFFRLLIFFIIVYFLISYLSKNQLKNNILGQNTLDININTETIKKTPIYQDIVNSATSSSLYQNNLKNINLSFEDFPQKQIKDIQKMIVTGIYRDIINNIENK